MITSTERGHKQMNYQIQEVDTSALTFSAQFDYYNDIRHPEDGTQLEGTAHYIVAETPDGRRFVRHYQNGCWVYGETDEGGEPVVYLSATIEELQAKIQPAVDKLNALEAPRLNLAEWRETEPCYGTDAWLAWHQEQIFDEDYMNQ